MENPKKADIDECYRSARLSPTDRALHGLVLTWPQKTYVECVKNEVLRLAKQQINTCLVEWAILAEKGQQLAPIRCNVKECFDEVVRRSIVGLKKSRWQQARRSRFSTFAVSRVVNKMATTRH